MKHEYFCNGVRISESRYVKLIEQLEMSSMDWEVDHSSNETHIYTMG